MKKVVTGFGLGGSGLRTTPHSITGTTSAASARGGYQQMKSRLTISSRGGRITFSAMKTFSPLMGYATTSRAQSVGSQR